MVFNMLNTNLADYLAQAFLDEVITIAKEAGEAIMQVYSTDFNVEHKEDKSPVTQADLAAHDVIFQGLNRLTPHIPVLSEESTIVSFETRKNWYEYWLIDPLDGTREFVKRNGEFTVNIALIRQHQTVLGVVYAPVTQVLYFATHGQGAFKQIQASFPAHIKTTELKLSKPVLAISHSHKDEKVLVFMQNLENKLKVTPELISIGSSLKICLVAEGVADVYPRLGPTSEWDTAAAHCVIQEAGGDIVDVAGVTLLYNTKSSLLNPFFFAKSGSKHDWACYL